MPVLLFIIFLWFARTCTELARATLRTAKPGDFPYRYNFIVDQKQAYWK